ncbi:MAG: VOC family protein [Dokdonella sp.]
MNSNSVVWFEIYVQDMARAQKFYEVVLGSKLESLGDPTDSSIQMMAFPGDMENYGANGALVKMDGAHSGGNSSLIYFGCEDCAEEGSRVASAGGRVEREKMSIGEYGCIVLAVDTEGNMFGLHSMK